MKSCLSTSRFKNSLSTLLLLLFLGLCQTLVANNDITLIYSSDFHGEIKPCGCTAEGDLGGILRRATKFIDLKKQHPDAIFVSAGDILGKNDGQGLIKAEYVLEAKKRLGLNAILPGERDLGFPAELIHKYDLPWVLTNKHGRMNFPDHISHRLANDIRVVIYGLLDPQLVKTGKLSDPASSLKQVFERTQVKTDDFVILLIHGSEKLVQQYAGHKMIDVIVRGHMDDVTVQKKTQSKPYLLSAGYRGQRIGQATFSRLPETKMSANLIIPLPNAIKDHAELVELYDRYDQSVTKWWKQKTASMKDLSEDNPYAPQTCAACHNKIYQLWKNSKHARAIGSLTRNEKQNDPECLACHTTGMHQPGGFISASQTPHMNNVMCEACHGPGQQHADYPVATKLTNGFSACLSCHTKENSPGFNLTRYWSGITHKLDKNTQIHKQSISRISGVYDVLAPDKPIIDNRTVEVMEFFSFYCQRCYIFNHTFDEIITGRVKPVHYRQIPVTFGTGHADWASLAFIVAEQAGKGREIKQAIFNAHFEQGHDLDDQQTILAIARKFNLEQKLKKAMTNPESDAARLLNHYRGLMKKNKIYTTPTLYINNNLRIMPSHTAGNTNLMLENVQEILDDIQCRKYAECN